MEEKNIDFVVEMMVGTIRNGLEDLHSGPTPSSKNKRYTDVKVVTPYGEIPWKKVSRISDKEMGELKDLFRHEAKSILQMLVENGLEIKIAENSPLARNFHKF